jgi:hypothetical protein
MSDKELTDIVENENNLDESAASETLKPNPTRTEMLATFTSLLAQLKGEDLSHFFNDSIKKLGVENVPSATAPGGGPALGQMPAATLGAMKEDVAEMFSGEDLSEEFKERVSTIFEAAISARSNLETVRLEEEFATKLDEAVVAIQEEMTEKVDQYLDYVVEQWIEENKLAIEASIRTNVTEDFMEGLRNLFAESYINVPDEKLDVLGELQAQVDELEDKLDESVNKQLELQAILDEATKEATFDEVSEGLAATQVEKLRTLAEGIDFSSAETYAKKLNIIKDKYFSEKKEVSTGVVTEEAENGVDQPVEVPAHMAHYVASISRNAK